MRTATILLALATASILHAAPLPSVLLWPGGAPGALGEKDDDKPSLTAFLPAPEKATGAAIVICPGGGYGGLAGHEGQGYAEWLADHGVAGLVLRYRLGSHGYRHPIEMGDAARAVRLARAKAADWKLDPHRIGIMGSSAGGHLASTLLTHFDAGQASAPDPIDQLSSRPDLGILCYAVITMGPNTHSGSRENLLGKDPAPALLDQLSNEKQVTKDTPPCFLWHTAEDSAVKVENSLEFATALRRAGVPFELHIYERGPHGIGLSQGQNGVAPDDVHPWGKDLLFWLKQRGFLR